LEEARVAIDNGADALGFNFWEPSPRYVTPEAASRIIEGIAPFRASIGVFVNETLERIEELASNLCLTAVQLHGDESPEFCARINGVRTIKALRVGDGFEPESIRCYPTNMILLDAAVRGSYGGTGRTVDWMKAAECARIARVILAGGLTADNVAEAMAAVCPEGIDVCSGVEAEPGRKDLNKLRDFMLAVERANARLA
jgi:phosphoribosylanthranilate isomerase